MAGVSKLTQREEVGTCRKCLMVLWPSSNPARYALGDD